jgi:hypothetical protein
MVLSLIASTTTQAALPLERLRADDFNATAYAPVAPQWQSSDVYALRSALRGHQDPYSTNSLILPQSFQDKAGSHPAFNWMETLTWKSPFSTNMETLYFSAAGVMGGLLFVTHRKNRGLRSAVLKLTEELKGAHEHIEKLARALAIIDDTRNRQYLEGNRRQAFGK